MTEHISTGLEVVPPPPRELVVTLQPALLSWTLCLLALSIFTLPGSREPHCIPHIPQVIQTHWWVFRNTVIQEAPESDLSSSILVIGSNETGENSNLRDWKEASQKFCTKSNLWPWLKICQEKQCSIDGKHPFTSWPLKQCSSLGSKIH
jgi:hypothetical protein